MNKKIISAATAIWLMAFSTLCNSCVSSPFGSVGNSQATVDQIDLATLRDFEKISVGSALQVTFTQGEAYSVRFEGSDDDLKHIVAKVDDGELVVHTINDWKNFGGRNVKVFITAPQLNELDISGATTFTSNRVSSRDFEAEASGASVISIDSLTCHEADIQLSGASSYQGKIGSANEISVDASGASHAQIWVSCTTLKADCSGASHITVKGTAQNRQLDSSGASTIDATALKTAN